MCGNPVANMLSMSNRSQFTWERIDRVLGAAGRKLGTKCGSCGSNADTGRRIRSSAFILVVSPRPSRASRNSSELAAVPPLARNQRQEELRGRPREPFGPLRWRRRPAGLPSTHTLSERACMGVTGPPHLCPFHMSPNEMQQQTWRTAPRAVDQTNAAMSCKENGCRCPLGPFLPSPRTYHHVPPFHPVIQPTIHPSIHPSTLSACWWSLFFPPGSGIHAGLIFGSP